MRKVKKYIRKKIKNLGKTFKNFGKKKLKHKFGTKIVKKTLGKNGTFTIIFQDHRDFTQTEKN